jgi:hypothetical protein
MSESLLETRYLTHELFQKADFTEEEIARGNLLAVAVLKQNHEVCKRCGRADAELTMHYCNERTR